MSECLFCRIAAKEIQSKIEFENDRLVAFCDINPQAPTHLLVIPKKHISKINEVGTEDKSLVGEMIFCAKDLAHKKGLDDGYRLVLNNGEKAGQTVFHIHLHLLGGRQMAWPPG